MRKLLATAPILAFLFLATALVAQTSYTPAPYGAGLSQFTDGNGVPLAGGFVYTYIAGTSTPQATFSDYTGGVPNSNPVALDSNGRASIFIGSASYKFVVANSATVVQYTVDGITGPVGLFAAPPAIGGTTPNTIAGTTINATSGFQVNGSPLNFTNLAGFPGSGIPNSTGSSWGTSFSTTGSGSVLALATSPTLVTPILGAATASSLAMGGGVISGTGAITPSAAGLVGVGSSSLPYLNVFIGTGVSLNSKLASLASTAGQTVSIPDCTSPCTLATTVTASQYFFVPADFTTAANTSLQAITGLTWTLPANTVSTIPFTCYFVYSQATAAATVSFGMQDVSVSPTNVNAQGTIQTNTTVYASGSFTNLNSTAATAVFNGLPSATATNWNAQMAGFIEQPSNVATSVFQIMVSTAVAADAVTVKRGSFCKIF